MKLLSLVSMLMVAFAAFSQPIAQPPQARKIQIAILFDTSNSMDGLIEQAKSTIWQIVNAASRLRNDGVAPQLEISLYDYGNSGITETNYIRQQTSLITDLDSLSGKLFGLRTNGGSEYCAAVIESALEQLTWSNAPEDLRLIYIAGNEPFNQGPIDYKAVLKKAADRNIIVNTIYCGSYENGVRELWYDGALLSQGNYFNIDSNRESFFIETPYDQQINAYNDSLNKTYLGYGEYGKMRKQKQITEDYNAGTKGASNTAERAVAKSSQGYSNVSWDIVDAYMSDSTRIFSLKDEDLPPELLEKSQEEIDAFIRSKAEERSNCQREISALAAKRAAYIEAEKQKRITEGDQEDLGTAIIRSMNTTAAQRGYIQE